MTATVHKFTASDGIELAWQELGQGKPVILLHGLFSDSQMNWVKFGTAERIAREGFRVIMPDLRAHASGKPHRPNTTRARAGPRPRGADAHLACRLRTGVFVGART